MYSTRLMTSPSPSHRTKTPGGEGVHVLEVAPGIFLGDLHRMLLLEPSLAQAQPDQKFQFERFGYFVADRLDHTPQRPVFNRAVGLKDSWGK